MNKFEWISRARKATTIDEIKDIMTEINQARWIDETLSDEAWDAVFGVCHDKLMELK